jgi:hypothetical protein
MLWRWRRNQQQGWDNEPKRNVGSGSRSSTIPSGSRKLMNWVSLFQDSEDTMRMENSELVQYSCSRLLREMEATEVESDEEKDPMCMDDAEVLRFPAEWIKEEEIKKRAQDLPDNIYNLPKLRSDCGVVSKTEEEMNLDGNPKKEGEPKWGPILVEKRPSRIPKDGRTVMEKAQARKKLVNLEGTKGISKTSNPFSALSSEEIITIAKDVGVSLGVSSNEIDKSILEVQSSDISRLENFNSKCDQCQISSPKGDLDGVDDTLINGTSNEMRTPNSKVD